MNEKEQLTMAAFSVKLSQRMDGKYKLVKKEFVTPQAPNYAILKDGNEVDSGSLEALAAKWIQ